jgi:hypothetical protein
MFHPAGPGKNLAELPLSGGNNPAAAIKHNRARTGRALIESQDVFHRKNVSPQAR